MQDTRRILERPEVIREAIFRNVKQAIRDKFPIESNEYRAELKSIDISHTPLSHNKQRKIIMAKGNSSDRVIVDIDLYDKATGKKVFSLKSHRLMNLPYFTNRYTFIINGVEYAVVSQLRTKSGVYTRVRGNETLEASFNLEKGANFKLLMDPETSLFKIDILHSTLPLFVVLRVLGADMEKVRQVIGNDIYTANNQISDANLNRTIETLYNKLVKYKTQLGDTASKAEKIEKIRGYFDSTVINKETTQITLGKPHGKVNIDSLLAAAKRILSVYNNLEDPDERDNLEFQKVFTVEDIIKEVIDKGRSETAKIKMRLNSFKPTGNTENDIVALKSVFSPVYFSQGIRTFITTSSISRTPSQINALEMQDIASTVTRLGEGAIRDERAVPESSRAVHYSYMGTIDPIAATESSKIGIDNKFTITARKGKDNEIYREVLNLKTGKIENIRVIDLFEKHVGMPDEIYVKGKEKPSDIVPAVYKGKLEKITRDKLDYQIPTPHDLYSIMVNSLPFLNSSQGNRLVMGSKHITQAMPLKFRERRLVESSIDSFNERTPMQIIGGFLEPHSPVDGEVTKIDEDYVYIKGSNGKIHKVDYENNTPLASKTMLHNDIIVKPGDKVKEGQVLGTSNFTQNGTLALGKNLRVGYMPYKGLNHEDGIIISESASKKLTSVHSERVIVQMDKTLIADKGKFVSQFPTKFTSIQLEKIGDDGIAKKGAVLEDGDPVVLVLADNANSTSNIVLGSLHKSLIRPYRDESRVYDNTVPATVLDSLRSGNTITVLYKVEKPAKIGDKLSGSYGNKGIISSIESDDKMLVDEDGKPLDAIMTSSGIINRINPAQILETAMGKVALRRGKPYKIENWEHPDNVSYVKNEMKKYGVKDKETLIDPVTGKKIPNIFTGVQYIHKLFKTTETNYSSRGIEGAHDQDETPVGSGESGPKSLGGMEVNALLAHNARNFLRDSTTLRNSKNLDFWSQFQQGKSPQIPIDKKTFNKFTGILNQAGIKIDRNGDEFVLGPLTDKDVLSISEGKIKNARRLDAKLNPESGGLFDVQLTGGLKGNKWSHIKLNEPVMNPVFEDCIKSLLDITTKQLESELAKDGGEELKKRLNKIDVPKLLTETTRKLSDQKVKGPALDKLVKKMKYLRVLKDRGLKAGDAYMIQHIPVTPPSMRPITIGRTGDKLENDANLLYRNLILENDTFGKIKKEKGLDDEIRDTRKNLQNSVRELVGTISPQTVQLKNSGVKGAIQFLSGDQPKHGYFQRKVIYSKMNLAGRATISPDVTLGLDEVGMPEDMAWTMYRPFILRRLSQMGYGALQAKKEVDDRGDTAKKILEDEMENRPALINRAPTLWKYGIMAAKPKLRSGKSILVNTLWETAFNADFDGDTETLHLPITDEAIKDAKNMLPSKLLFSDRRRGDLLMFPKMEPIIGLYKITENLGKARAGAIHRYPNEEAAWKDYYAGKLKATDFVEVTTPTAKAGGLLQGKPDGV